MSLLRYLKQVIGELGKDRAGQLSAALAYASIFAIAPLILVVVSVIGFFFGEKAVQGQLFTHLSDYVGANSAQTIQNAIVHIHNSEHNGIALAIGLVGSLFAAAAITTQLQNAFDMIFSVAPDPSAGFRSMVYTKLKNAAVLIAGSLVMATSILISALITGLGKRLQDQLGTPETTLQIINLAASLAIFVLMLYLIYRVLPDVRLPRKIVFWASTLVGLLFLAGKVVLGVVIGRNGTASAYGAAASLITLLLWFFYTGQILFLGAEGIKVYLSNRGYTYKPKKYTLRQKTTNIRAKNNLRGQTADHSAARTKAKNIR